jgi:hypothetical protein
MHNNSPFCHFLGFEYKNAFSMEYGPVAGRWMVLRWRKINYPSYLPLNCRPHHFLLSVIQFLRDALIPPLITHDHCVLWWSCVVSLVTTRHNSATSHRTGTYTYWPIAVDKEKCFPMVLECLQSF